MTENLTKSLSGKVKEAGLHTVIYGLGSVLQAVLGFLLIPLYTKYYTPDIYGVLALLTICATLGGSVFYLGASSALARSYYDYEEGLERKKTISTSLFITLAGAGIQLLLGITLRNEISIALFQTTDYAPHVAIILSSSAFSFTNNLFYLILRFERKSKQVISLNVLSLVLSASLIIVFLTRLHMGVMAPILGEFLNQVLLLVILFSLTRKSFTADFSSEELGIQLRFGIPALFAGLGYYLLSWSDRFFINQYCTLHEVGIYSLGYKFGAMIHIFLIIPFSQIWAPMRMEYRNDSDAREFFRLILTYYFMAGILFTVSVSLFAKEILSLMSGRPDYIVAYQVVPIIMIGHLMYGTINIIDYGIYFSRKIIYHTFIFWLGVIVNMGLNYVFIPQFGYMAAAYNALFTFCLIVFLVYAVSQKLYPIPLDKRRLAVLFATGATVLAGNQLGQPGNAIADALLRSLSIAAMVGIMYLLVFDRREKDVIEEFVGVQKSRLWKLLKTS
jgi:O-antigen/teichoic acid export membrane protein